MVMTFIRGSNKVFVNATINYLSKKGESINKLYTQLI